MSERSGRAVSVSSNNSRYGTFLATMAGEGDDGIRLRGHTAISKVAGVWAEEGEEGQTGSVEGSVAEVSRVVVVIKVYPGIINHLVSLLARSSNKG